MQNLKNLKEDKQSSIYSEFRNSIFCGTETDSQIYILHNHYLAAFLKSFKLTTQIDFKNSINVELRVNNRAVYLPFIFKNIEVVLWKL